MTGCRKCGRRCRGRLCRDCEIEDRAEERARATARLDEDDDGDEGEDPVPLPDGGDVAERCLWAFDAIIHGADVDPDCLALTGSGKPCSYNAYESNDAPVCNTHASANDPVIIDDAHQWARIDDGQAGTITVCVNCRGAWYGDEPETVVPCPECSAGVGERCRDDESAYSAPIPPHPTRRERAYDAVNDLDPCEANPLFERDVVTDGGRVVHPADAALTHRGVGDQQYCPHGDPACARSEVPCFGCLTGGDADA